MISDFRDDLLTGRHKSTRGPEYPVLGHVRSGIMRLVRPKQDASPAEVKAYENRVVVYQRLVEQGLSWEDIGKQIGGMQFLTPQNEDYFTVRPIDCRTNPENAEILKRLYADPDGKLRKLPIVFLSNDWIECIPHQLAVWSKTKWLYRSEYVRVRDEETGEMGYKRICVKPVPYEKGKRPFGGQDITERGPCVPEDCTEYQKGDCKLSGYVQGVIPGTKGAGVWNIYTKSIYSFRQMMQKFKLVEKATGRIVALIDKKTQQPVFSVFKVPDAEVSRYVVETGKTQLTSQDLIHIEANIDMYDLMLAYQPQAVLERGKEAQRAITGASPQHETTANAPERRTSASEEAPDIAQEQGNDCPRAYDADNMICQNCDYPDDCKEQTQKVETEREAEKAQITAITRAAVKFGVAKAAVEKYCAGLTYDQAVEAIRQLNKGQYDFIEKAA